MKRLNLRVLELASQSGGVLIIDATKRKMLPDSFSRTIPIWCCVWNRVVTKYRSLMQITEPKFWDIALYSPAQPPEDIEERLNEFVTQIIESGMISDPQWLLRTLKLPLRPYFCSNPNIKIESDRRYACIICVNASKRKSQGYEPGAADDHELWGRGLTPQLFWDNILQTNDIQKAIDTILSTATQKNFEDNDITYSQNYYAPLGESGIAVGSRRAGRPPECWANFDAIINVSTLEYPTELPSSSKKKYLFLPVKEGKKDRTELERWLPLACFFAIMQVTSGKSLLIHCAQGLDRSVAVAMAFVALFCSSDSNALQRHTWCNSLNYKRMYELISPLEVFESLDPRSGLPCFLCDHLQGRSGRDFLFTWILEHSPFFLQNISKLSLKIVLHRIQRYHEKASPSRSTIQKLHRFFFSNLMSGDEQKNNHERQEEEDRE